VAAPEDQPSWRFGDEEEADAEEERDNVNDAEGDEVRRLVGSLARGEVDDGSNERSLPFWSVLWTWLWHFGGRR